MPSQAPSEPGVATKGRGHAGPPEIIDLVTRFSTVCARRGEAVAVMAPEGTFTYAQLDGLSNQLAHRLRSLGVERDSRVGISLPRGASELLALLATAKAGGAYVPLDPSHPIDRLRGIVTDAAPQVMVAHPDSPLCSAAGASGQVLMLGDIARAVAGHPSTPLGLSYDVGQAQYILFTSGSTGRPKGVEISRGAFSNFLGSMAHTPGMSEKERLLAITTTSFDIAGLELFLPLWVGATVEIVDKETVRDPKRLRKRVENEAVSLMQATPATWRMLLETGWRPHRGLRMFCGGEAMSPALANRLLDLEAELWNLYGPTETTVWSSLEQVLPGFDRITVGLPIDRTQMYILDEGLQPLAEGKEGEIWIGGHGLARGYFGRPELTAERFLQNPHGPPGDRIYRTGDLGRKLPDGRFECLGRLDHQVKIRGFRIELGEIETVLLGVPGVSESVVVADEREGHSPRLVAYWVGNAEREDLIDEARLKLPEYMVPSHYIRLELIPLNTNGKIDRKRLPPPEAVKVPGPPPKRPRTDTETRIAAVFRHVLGLAEVGVDQDFFTLGGTSLLAAQVVAQIERELEIDVPLQGLFEARTVEGLAARLGGLFSPEHPIVVTLRKGSPDQPPLWCLFGVTIYQELAMVMDGDQTVIGVHVPVLFVPGRDATPTIAEVAARYVDLIRGQQPRGPYHLLGLCFGGIVAHEVARQLEVAGEKIALVTVLDAILPQALHIDRWKKLHTYLQRAVEDPKHFARSLARTGKRAGGKLLGRVPLLSRLGPSGDAAASVEPIDLPVEGPEVDAAVAEFASQPHRLSGPLLIVRATREPTQPHWAWTDPDLGWSGFADRVISLDVESQHLQVLHEPHVRALARSMATALAGKG